MIRNDWGGMFEKNTGQKNGGGTTSLHPQFPFRHQCPSLLICCLVSLSLEIYIQLFFFTCLFSNSFSVYSHVAVAV